MLIETPHRAVQAGSMLIEAIIGLLVFAIGMLGLIGLQAVTIAATADAQYRTEAARRAEQILSEIWLTVDRSSATTMQASLNAFTYNVNGTTCSFSGGAVQVGNSTLTAWVASMTSGTATQLPGATAAMLQIMIDTAADNQVTVTVCWRAPQDRAPRNHVLVGHIS